MVPSMGTRRGEPVSGFSLWIFKGFLWIAASNKDERRNQKKIKFGIVPNFFFFQCLIGSKKHAREMTQIFFFFL